MYHDNPSTTSSLIGLSPQTLYRGIYVRIARKLKVDPSYVSRVARGERRSPGVENALAQEIGQINKKLGSASQSANAKPASKPGKRLKFFVARERNALRQAWLGYIHRDANLRHIKLSTRSRTAPVLPIIDEALKSMEVSVKNLTTKPMKAAKRHGAERRTQAGYTTTTVLEEYNLIRRCIHEVARQNLKRLESETLINDLGQLGEVLDLQSQNAIREFLAS